MKYDKKTMWIPSTKVEFAPGETVTLTGDCNGISPCVECESFKKWNEEQYRRMYESGPSRKEKVRN
jgi:hypothetical protein